MGRRISRTAQDSSSEGYVYNQFGLATYTDQLGKETTYGYDQAGRKTAETNANIEVTLYNYNAAGDLTMLTDPESHTTTWNYDKEGELTNKIDHTSQTILAYAYDRNGRLTNRWSAAKGNTAYAYDAIGNLTNVNYPTSADISFVYDPGSRLISMHDGIGNTTFTYDELGQILSENGPWANDTLSYTYENQLRNSMTLLRPNASPWIVDYGYDEVRRVKTVSAPSGTVTYQYLGGLNGLDSPAELIRSLALPNGSTVTNGYDQIGRLLATHLRSSGNALLNGHDYVYNDLGQRTRQTFASGNYMDYTYDDARQLVSALGKESGGSPSRDFEQLQYFYDGAGNLTIRTNNALAQTFSVNALNQLTSVTRNGTLDVAGTTSSEATQVSINGQAASLYGDFTFSKGGFSLVDGTNTFTAVAQDAYGREDTDVVAVYLPSTNLFAYDANGNLRTNGARFYDYDDENQLIRVTEPGSWKSEFFYDGRMRKRIQTEYEWTNGAWKTNQIVRYVYDGVLVVQERNGMNVPTVAYTRGKDLSGDMAGAGGIGGLLIRTDLTTSRDPHAYYHADGNGNITALLNSEEAVVARYAYDPFGKTTTSSGPLADANTYRFSSKEHHQPSSLIYYLYRFYDPNLQRWVNRDPVEELGGINLYGFVGNQPISTVDNYGLFLASPGPTTIPATSVGTKVGTKICGRAGPLGVWAVIWFKVGEVGSGPLANCFVPDTLYDPSPLPCPKKPPQPAAPAPPPMTRDCDFAKEEDGPTEDSKTCWYDCNGALQPAYFPKGTKCPGTKSFPVKIF